MSTSDDTTNKLQGVQSIPRLADGGREGERERERERDRQTDRQSGGGGWGCVNEMLRKDKESTRWMYKEADRR